MSHIISGYKEVQNQKRPNEISNQTSANESSNQGLAVQRQRAPLAPIHHVQQEGQIHQAMIDFNPVFCRLDVRDFHQASVEVPVP